ncbi:hypothetical protein BRADI_3g42965v3 [Brachypodium distachyon]|uniref:Peptidase C1A papain C-terminal domain-containing protein n=1 Tax=Brachypodium distachyon TaxID=15368 RepID=A0A0Q3FIB1_BRADI|nr:hypothetical protein BRADI_3g42965v3 [Brachypodium distachyon]
MADEEYAEEEDFHFLLFGNDDNDGGSGTGSSEEEEDNADDGDDYEFLLGVQDGRPPIHHQEGDTCVFHAITFAAEMEMRRRDPTTDMEIGMNLADQSAAPLGTFPSYHREATGLRLFRRSGVLARSATWEGERRLQISSYRVHRNVNGVSFAEVAQLISEGRSVIGMIRANERFRRLPPGEIYDYYLRKPGGQVEEDETYTHAVSFIVYGFRQGREYLVMANSHGNGFGEDGLARVYFNSVYDDRFYTLTATPPDHQDLPSSSAVPPRFFHVGSSSSGSGAAHDHGFFFDTGGGSSSSTAPSFSDDHGTTHSQRVFEVGSTSSSAAPRMLLFDDDGSRFSPLFFSPSDAQSFFSDGSALSLSPSATHNNSFNGGSSSSPSTAQSFFDDGSAVVASGPASSSTAPSSSSAGGPTSSSSAAPSSSRLLDE